MRARKRGTLGAALVAALCVIFAAAPVPAQRRGNRGNNDDGEAGGGHHGENNNNHNNDVGRRGERQGQRGGDDQARTHEQNADPEALRGQQRGGDQQQGGGDRAGRRGGGLADAARQGQRERAAPERPVNETASRIKDSPYATRLAQRLSETVQRDVNHLVNALRAGNDNPGIGTRGLERGYRELRGNNRGRVIVKQTGERSYDIVGKFEGHERGDAENNRTIQRLIREYEANR
jgi:hypothetical protein